MSYSVFDSYFKLTKDTESARITHRWACVSLIATLLGSNVHIQFGNTKVYPNLFILLVGSAGSRKSTAIKFAATQLRAAKYFNIAASSTSREQFFEDFGAVLPVEILEQWKCGLLTDDELDKMVSEYAVIADEFTDFAGVNNSGMYTSLGNLWDYRGVFEYRPKHGKKVAIINPVLNILGGTTADAFALAFPPATINQGLPSRLIIVNAMNRRRKIAWPIITPESEFMELKSRLLELKKLKGEMAVSDQARAALRDIYEGWTPIPDARFATYGNRRYVQLLKLCMIVAASQHHMHIQRAHVVEANTILTFAENHMPDALGEFGLNKSSVVSARILNVVRYAPDGIISINDIYKAVAADVENFDACRELLMNMVQAAKIQITSAGVTPVVKDKKTSTNEMLHCKLHTLWENEKTDYT